MGWRQVAFPLIVIIAGPGFTGIYTYAPAPGRGNLIASTGIAQAGTDPFGNAYLAGDTSYTKVAAGQYFAESLQGGSLVWYYATSETGPWVAMQSLAPGFLNFATKTGPFIQTDIEAEFAIGDLGPFFLLPSGDTTGAADAANIVAAFGLGYVWIILTPGLFYFGSTVVIGNGQTIQGSGIDKTYAVSAATAGSPAQGVICLGPLAANTVVTQPALLDLSVKGNAFSGHGVIVRAENPTLHNIFNQFAQNDAYHFSWDSIAGPSFLDGADCYNLWADRPGLCGIFTDQYLVSSEFQNCRLDGGIAPSFGGTYGIHCQGGENKFLNCHPYGFALGGALFDGTAKDNSIIGGEYESNGGPHITIDAVPRIRITDVDTYFSTAYTGGKPTSDIHIFGNAADCQITNNRLNGASTDAAIITDSVFRCAITGNDIGPSPYDGSFPANGIVNDFGSGGNTNSICNNTIQCAGGHASAIDLGGSSFNVVNGNVVVTVSDIVENTGGNNNIITSNMVPNGAIHVVGGATVNANNIV